jgi:hypothetical protein
LELDECLRYIIEHGDMDVFVDVVSVNIHSKIMCAVPVLGLRSICSVHSGCWRGAQHVHS